MTGDELCDGPLDARPIQSKTLVVGGEVDPLEMSLCPSVDGFGISVFSSPSEDVRGGRGVAEKGCDELFGAAHAGNVAEVRRLLEAGESANVTDDFGRTPLCWASASGHTGVVQLLLDKGAKVSQAGNWQDEQAENAARLYQKSTEDTTPKARKSLEVCYQNIASSSYSLDRQPNDVLYGKGVGRNSSHPGNAHYIQLVRQQADVLSSLSKLERERCVRSIVDQVVRSWTPPGRFLKLDKHGQWNELSDDMALRKARQAIYDVSRKRRQDRASSTTPWRNNGAEDGANSADFNVPQDSLTQVSLPQVDVQRVEVGLVECWAPLAPKLVEYDGLGSTNSNDAIQNCNIKLALPRQEKRTSIKTPVGVHSQTSKEISSSKKAVWKKTRQAAKHARSGTVKRESSGRQTLFDSAIISVAECATKADNNPPVIPENSSPSLMGKPPVAEILVPTTQFEGSLSVVTKKAKCSLKNLSSSLNDNAALLKKIATFERTLAVCSKVECEPAENALVSMINQMWNAIEVEIAGGTMTDGKAQHF